MYRVYKGNVDKVATQTYIGAELGTINMLCFSPLGSSFVAPMTPHQQFIVTGAQAKVAPGSMDPVPSAPKRLKASAVQIPHPGIQSGFPYIPTYTKTLTTCCDTHGICLA